MIRHEVKVNKEFFDQILNGDKNFEIRLGDKVMNSGEILVLQEKDPLDGSLTGRSIEKTITVVRNTKDVTHWSKEEIEKYGLQIIGFK